MVSVITTYYLLPFRDVKYEPPFPLLSIPPRGEGHQRETILAPGYFNQSTPRFYAEAQTLRGLIFIFPVPLKFEVMKNEELSSDFIWNQALSACCLDTNSLLIELLKKKTGKGIIRQVREKYCSERVKRHSGARPVSEHTPREIGKGRALRSRCIESQGLRDRKKPARVRTGRAAGPGASTWPLGPAPPPPPLLNTQRGAT